MFDEVPQRICGVKCSCVRVILEQSMRKWIEFVKRQCVTEGGTLGVELNS